MPKINLKTELTLAEICDSLTFANWRQWRSAIVIFATFCLNLALASTVYAATTGTIEKGTALAIAFLILLTIALSIYLFAVIIQPERF